MDEATKSAPAAAAPPVDEFAGIPSPRTRHPVLAFAVVAIAAFLVFHVRADLSYALSSQTPLNLGDARGLFAPAGGGAPLPVNRYVRLAGVPDRQSALQIDTQGSWHFSQLFRILGTGARLYVHRPEDPLPADKAARDVFEGRLIRFRDLSFESSIRRYFVSHVSATHFFRPGDLKGAAGRPAASLHDLAGDPVTLQGGDILAIDLARTDEVRVSLPRERFPAEADARAEIERRGGTVLGPPPGEPPATHHAFRVTFPAARREVALAELGDLDRHVEIQPERETQRVRLAEISDGGDALILGSIRAPLSEVRSVRTLAPVEIPEDAYLLVEADVPRDHLYAVLVTLVLAFFVAVNLSGLRRGLKTA